MPTFSLTNRRRLAPYCSYIPNNPQNLPVPLGCRSFAPVVAGIEQVV
ncbi:MAG: hypothetical protein QGG36_21660 [Pirellulaceae bacterium]|nr:hypothetical protein [Pirellulaceae bacterium]MDP7018427.1 hypothetical protein [Pirellulaceae bacterium]